MNSIILGAAIGLVVGLIIVLATLVVGVANSSLVDSYKVVGSADRLSGWLLQAKARALRDRVPVGLRRTWSRRSCGHLRPGGDLGRRRRGAAHRTAGHRRHPGVGAVAGGGVGAEREARPRGRREGGREQVDGPDPGEAERRRLQGIADEEARRRRRAEMEAGAATPEEAARYAAEALAAAGGAS